MPWERTPRADNFLTSRLLEWLTRAVVRFPVFTLVLAAAGVAVSIWLTATQLGFRTSRAELLSPDSEFNRRWLDYTAEFGDKEDVVVVVEGDSREQITPVLDDVYHSLKKSGGMFAAVMHKIEAPRLREKGLYYLDTEELRQIDGLLRAVAPLLQGGAPQSDRSAAAGLSDQLAGIERSLAAKSPDGFFSAGFDRLISDDGRTGFVLLKLTETDTQSFAQSEASITALRQISDEVKARHPGVKIGLTGLPVIEYDEMRSSEASMTLATILSFLGVLAVMIVTFGGFRHSLLAMGALLVGMIWACGCAAITIGYVNILSIAFGSILFGLGIDYGVNYVAHYLKHRIHTDSTTEALARTAAEVGHSILTGALTSAVAFFAAVLTEFPGVSQFGLLAGCGIILCWLSQATVLPAMIRLSDSDGLRENLPAPLDLRGWLRPLFAFPRLSLAGGAAVVAACAVGIHYLHYDFNLLNLQPSGLESVELEHKLFEQTNRSAWYAISIADTPQEALARRAAFEKLPSVEKVIEIASAIPPDVEEKRPIIERINRCLAMFPPNEARMPGAIGGGNLPAVSLPGNLGALRRLQTVACPEPPRLNDLPECITSRFLGKNGKFMLQVYGKVNIWDVEPMGRFVAEVRTVDPNVTGNPLQVYEASRQMKMSFERAAAYALLFIVPLIFFDFRRLDHTLLSMLPMATGMLMTVGVMGLLDIPLNQANLIFLPLVLGIGIDDAIHLVNDFRRQGRRYQKADNAVIVAVVVNTLTTMVGFGALMIANHRGLQSLGRVLTISMACCLFTSLLLPNLLRIGGFTDRGGNEEPDNAESDSGDDEDEYEAVLPWKTEPISSAA
ncbi:MAG: MMPL family transporter [Pirellulaceae bacterium]|nr:MMPL family transporter [Pirellulaceae bacterium]